MRDLELYLHIPFCVRKCAYCDFLSAPAGRDVQQAYVGALQREIRGFAQRAAKEYCVTTVFFGGGTPSILPASDIAALMDEMRDGFAFAPDAEVTIECNPGTADREKLRGYHEAGINRLSLGLQSADDNELAMLGRIHTWADFQRTYEDARAAGFDNINVDLMSALPCQTAASWERTLRNVLALSPEHISAYSLIIEEGTPFYEKYHEDDEIRKDGGVPQFLPSEDAERRMYEMTEELSGEAGLRRYEISNYARPGRECRHNIGYWRGIEYMGFGLGASSLIAGEFGMRPQSDGASGLSAQLSGRQCMKGDNAGNMTGEACPRRDSAYTRFRNPDDLTAYLHGDFSRREMQMLTMQDSMEEFMFLGLRLTDGISEAEFERRFGCPIDKIYGMVLEEQQGLGLLARREGRIFLTPRGLDLSNLVMAEFLLDA